MLPEDGTPGVSIEKIEGIPLYLIPKTIAEEIRKKRESVFQINVERKMHHCYSIKVETFDEHAVRQNLDTQALEKGDPDE
ncbi:MAG: hypothetical protein WC593_13385 [Methanoregula sp.]